ncbi:hypothetical protein MRX96_010798 [Rhipicephalus microplus]
MDSRDRLCNTVVVQWTLIGQETPLLKATSEKKEAVTSLWTAILENKKASTSRNFKCSRYRRFHAARRYPAYGKTCYMCKGRNHFVPCCQSSGVIFDVKDEMKTPYQNDYFDVLDVAIGNISSYRDWIMKENNAGKEINLKIDTGSQANLIPLSLFRKIRIELSLQKNANFSLQAHIANIDANTDTTFSVTRSY